MDDYLREIQGKAVHDPYTHNFGTSKPRCLWFPGAVIVGAGPSGLAAAACLKQKGIQSLILERSNCIASLWQFKTYDRLKLHLPKQFCHLPFFPIPDNFPKYPSRHQFVDYLHAFKITPLFNQTVENAEFDRDIRRWRVKTAVGDQYVCRWLIVATGENADAAVPEIDGMEEFEGEIAHTCRYKSGKRYERKTVLVVGCGNSGMEVCLDLCQHNARPWLVVRDTVHVLPREVLGRSTFGVSMWLLKWLPMSLVDRFLLAVARLVLGDTARFGLDRPRLGPLQLKSLSGKTPVLDVGTLDKIRSGDIKVCRGIRRLRHKTVEFVDGRRENFDAIILATGYKSNVPSWLKESEMFNNIDGLPKRGFPNGWKGNHGLYAVGFTKRGILGASMDAKNIALDIQTNLLSSKEFQFFTTK